MGSERACTFSRPEADAELTEEQTLENANDVASKWNSAASRYTMALIVAIVNERDRRYGERHDIRDPCAR